eukprot:TRINITY_DN411_c0_g1_i1.p1 TRINITY_DN411_c0_g1~~TRINITY_DN411_c0_g1_i1.p1  ORF type:complete len:500 (+),score=88.19 TRINITY_DN411_c0_g1_i1:84-1583(+)
MMSYPHQAQLVGNTNGRAGEVQGTPLMPTGTAAVDPLLAGPFMAPFWEATDEAQTIFTANSTPTPTDGYTTPHSNNSLTKPPVQGGNVSPTGMMQQNMTTQIQPGRSLSPAQLAQQHHQQINMYPGARATTATPIVVAQLREEFSGAGHATPNSYSTSPPPPMWGYTNVTTAQGQAAQPQVIPQLPQTAHSPYQYQQVVQQQQQQQQQPQQQQAQQQPVSIVQPKQETAPSGPATCKVVLLKNVPWTVDLNKLQSLLESFIAAQHATVTKLLPVWDTGMVFAELTKPIALETSKLQIGDGWVDLEVARNGKVNVAPESCVLQARFIALTPGRDISVPHDAQGHGQSRRSTHQAFTNLGNARLTPSGALLLATQLGTGWSNAIIPPASVRSTKQTIQHLRRKYAQILIKYANLEEAKEVKKQCDGTVIAVNNLTFVLRLEFAKQSTSSPSGRVAVTPADLETTSLPVSLEEMFVDEGGNPAPSTHRGKGGNGFQKYPQVR